MVLALMLSSTTASPDVTIDAEEPAATISSASVPRSGSDRSHDDASPDDGLSRQHTRPDSDNDEVQSAFVEAGTEQHANLSGQWVVVGGIIIYST
jgi:hypothetical protein